MRGEMESAVNEKFANRYPLTRCNLNFEQEWIQWLISVAAQLMFAYWLTQDQHEQLDVIPPLSSRFNPRLDIVFVEGPLARKRLLIILLDSLNVNKSD